MWPILLVVALVVLVVVGDVPEVGVSLPLRGDAGRDADWLGDDVSCS